MARLQCSLPLVVAVAVLAAGCGGGGNSDSSDDTTTTSGSGGASTTSNAYQAGFETCSGGTVEEIAALYGVPEATPEAVGEVIAEQFAGGSGEHDSIKQGCIDAFAKSP
jgi:hypothetical protein